MNWYDDPEIQAQQLELSARKALIRGVLIWTPLFVAVGGLLAFFLVDRLTGGERATIFLLVVLSAVTALLGFQAIPHVLDLRGEPREVTGKVFRRWSKSDSLVMRSHYIRLEKNIFRVDRDIHGEINVGDNVRVRYYPRSATVIRVEKVQAPPQGVAE